MILSHQLQSTLNVADLDLHWEQLESPRKTRRRMIRVGKSFLLTHSTGS